MAVQAQSPAAGLVTVVEFYNAAQDHYFVTTSAQEIADLELYEKVFSEQAGRRIDVVNQRLGDTSADIDEVHAALEGGKAAAIATPTATVTPPISRPPPRRRGSGW